MRAGRPVVGVPPHTGRGGLTGPAHNSGRTPRGGTRPGAPVSVGEGPDTKPTARGQPAAVGRVVVLSGPSAVGKSTVVRCLRERIPNLHFSVSATTRAPRPGEVDGVDYHFIDPTRFQQLIDQVSCWNGQKSTAACTGRALWPSRCGRPRRLVCRCLSRLTWPGPGRSRRRCPRLSPCFWRHLAGRIFRPD